MFHKHKWIKVKETYAKPLNFTGNRIKGVGINDILERIIHGVTTILWKCDKCHQIRREEMLGRGVREVENGTH